MTPERHDTSGDDEMKARNVVNAVCAVYSRFTLAVNELGGTLPPMTDSSVTVLCNMPDKVRSLRIALWNLLETLNGEHVEGVPTP